MVEPFTPDLFSVQGPGWAPVSDDVARTVGLLLASAADGLAVTHPPEQARGLEINSNNLRVRTNRGELAVKRWSASADRSATVKTLELMEWLVSRGLPVPPPVRLNGDLVIEHNGSRWSAFGFIHGSWFVGSGNEAASAATVSGSLAGALSRLPDALMPGAGPEHLTDADDALLSRVESERTRWPALLGDEHAATLSAAWRDITTTWRALRDDPPDAGPRRASHFDLHPHNLLMCDGAVAAVLDFEACRTMPVGYAMAFAGVKQGRQTVVAAGNFAGARDVGATFLRRFCAACPDAAPLARVADLATAEVLRRISIILRLNLEQGNSTWNAVLPVQIAHLKEARLLFN